MNTHALKEGENVAKRGMLSLLILGVVKLSAGLVTGMAVIIADAVSTFSDILGVFASYIGLHMSRKSATEHFKYGYHKIETFAALVVSIGIVYLGYKVFVEGVETLQTSSEGIFRSFAITTTAISIIVSKRLEIKLRTVAEKTNSLSLMANARDKKVDFYSGIAVLASIIANYQEIPYVEGLITIAISLVILKVGIWSTKDSLFFLLDYWDNPKLTRKIKKVLSKDKDLVLNVSNLKLRRAGNFIFGEAFVEINPFAGIQDLREELELLKKQIEELDPYIKEFAIYSHISEFNKAKIAVPIKNSKGINSPIADTLKQTQAYLFANISKNKIGKHYTKKLKSGDRKPLNFASFLKKEKINIVIDNNLNSLTYFNLRRTHHILVYPRFADVKTAKKALELLLIDK